MRFTELRETFRMSGFRSREFLFKRAGKRRTSVHFSYAGICLTCSIKLAGGDEKPRRFW